jgi:hypothetical protein
MPQQKAAQIVKRLPIQQLDTQNAPRKMLIFPLFQAGMLPGCDCMQLSVHVSDACATHRRVDWGVSCRPSFCACGKSKGIHDGLQG